MFRKEVCQHLRNDARGIGDIHEGEVAEEEIHGSVESAVQSDQKDNKDVPQQGQQVSDWEQDEEGHLNVPVTGQAKENEFSRPSLVICSHIKQRIINLQRESEITDAVELKNHKNNFLEECLT